MGSVRHRFVTFDGLELFYREAGPLDAPTVLLLHGFPSSSIQFRHLLATLSDGWRLVAPDLPGFGLSAVPNHKRYEYSFGNLATTIEHFLQAVQLEPRVLYLHDYGAQTGFRLAHARRSAAPCPHHSRQRGLLRGRPHGGVGDRGHLLA